VLFELAPTGMSVVSLDGRWLWANRALLEILGYTREEMLGIGFSDVTHPEDRGPDLEAMARLLAGEIPRFLVEKRYLNKGGATVWVRITSSLVRDGTGAPLHIVTQTEDITVERAIAEERRLLATVMQQTDRAIILRSPEGVITHWNEGAETLYGYTAAEAIGQPPWFLIPADRAGEGEELSGRAMAGETIRGLQTLRQRKDGTIVDVSLTVAPIREEGGRLIGYSTITRDVTEERRARERLIASEQQLKDAQALAHVGSWEWVLAEERAILTSELCRILGQPEGFSPTQLEFAALIIPEDRPAAVRGLRNVANGQSAESEYRIMRPDGEIRYLHALTNPKRDDDGRITRVFGAVQDITERKRYEAELERLATHDALTGLPNRRTFDSRLSLEYARAERSGLPLSLAMLDIDHFKRVNDTLGHPVGDVVLARVASLLGEQVRGDETIARVGGEEFAWILPGAGGEQAVRAVERARRAVAAAEFDGIDAVRLSAGVCVVSDGIDLVELYRRADDALLAAKHGGRDRVVLDRSPVRAPDQTGPRA
jgi:diguanylate cyclase (GGDEF)-like protein/PAS domain S-box-containing protein